MDKRTVNLLSLAELELYYVLSTKEETSDKLRISLLKDSYKNEYESLHEYATRGLLDITPKQLEKEWRLL